MAFDYRKLKGKIIEVFGTQSAFSVAMGWSERTTSLKLNGKIPWKQPEIFKAINLLNLMDNNIQEYFFTLKVQSFEQGKAEVVS